MTCMTPFHKQHCKPVFKKDWREEMGEEGREKEGGRENERTKENKNKNV